MIIHISGPSGSGKTTLGNKLKKKFNIYDNIELFDEINKLKNVKNFHYNLFVNAGHLIYLDKKAVNTILEKI